MNQLLFETPSEYGIPVQPPTTLHLAKEYGIPVNGGPKYLYHVKQHMSNSQRYLVIGLVGLVGFRVRLGLPLTVTIRVSIGLVLWLVSGLAEFGTAVYRFAKNTPGNMIFSSDIGLCGKKCSSAQNQSFWWPSIVLTAKQVCHSPVILVASDS